MAIVLIGLLVISPEGVRAADGSGTVLESPSSASVGSAGNTFQFTYTATETMRDGGVKVTLPAGWSAPQTSTGVAGKVSVSSTATIGKSENTL